MATYKHNMQPTSAEYTMYNPFPATFIGLFPLLNSATLGLTGY